MANISEAGVVYPITAEDLTKVVIDAAKAGLKGFQDYSANIAAKMKAQFESMQKQWMGISAAFYASAKVMQQAWNVADQAAQFEEQQKGLNALTAQYGITADAMTRMVKKSVDGQLSLVEASNLASRSLSLGLDPQKVVAFTGYAERLTDVVGGSIPAAFEAMERAAQTGQTRGLAQYKVMVDLEQAVQKYAQSHGVAKEALGQHTLMMIRADAILAALKRTTDRFGEGVTSTADKMNRLRATVADIRLDMGAGLIRAFAGVSGAFHWLASGAVTAAAGILRVLEAERQLRAWINEKVGADKWAAYHRAKADELRGTIDAMMGAGGKLMDKAMDNFDAMMARSGDIAKAMAMPAVADDKPYDAAAKKKRDDLIKQIQDQTAKAELTERQHIQWQAAQWRKQVGDHIAIRNWEAAELAKIDQKMRDEGDKLLKIQAEQDLKAIEDWDKAALDEKKRFEDNRLKMEQDFAKIYQTRAQNEIDEFLAAVERRNAKIKSEMEALAQFAALTNKAISDRYNETWAQMIGMANQIGGEAGIGMGQLAANMKNIADIDQKKDSESIAIEEARQRYEVLRQAKVEEWYLNQAFADMEVEIEQRKWSQKLSIARSSFGMMAGLAKTLYALSGQQNEMAFKAYQAFAIADAVVSTYQAANKALASAPPPWNIALAAMVTAVGLANVASIAQQKIGGGISSPGTPGGGYAPTSPTQPTYQPEARQESKRATPIINVYVNGVISNNDEFARTLIPSLTKAWEDGQR